MTNNQEENKQRDESTRKFANGLMFRKPPEKAPDFVKGKLSIRVEEFKQFLDENEKEGWVNIDLKESQQGRYYAVLDEWVPNQEAQEHRNSYPENNNDNEEDINKSIPF